MISNKSIVSPSCVSATPGGLSAENLKDFVDIDVKRRKSILRMEYEAKLKLYAEKLKQTEQRVVDLANRRQVEKLQKIARNRKRFEKVQEKVEALKTEKFYRKIKLTEAWQNRDRKKMKQIANTREIKAAEKQEKLLQRYMTMVENQNRKLEKNAALIDRCIVNPHLYYNDKPKEKIEEIENEIPAEESSEQCVCSQTTNIKSGVDRETDYENRVKIMERFENLKAQYNACDHCVMFWEKTAPLWDRMTQCLNDTLTTARDEESDESCPRSDHGKDPVQYAPPPSLMQQVMMDDVDYDLTDKEMIEVLTKSRKMAGLNATPLEIINLAKRIVEHEGEVKACADYMVHGLVERSIFEFVKRNVSKRIFVDMRKAVDRLRHANDAGVIPDKPLHNKDVAGVTKAVYDLIHDDSYRGFDQPVDDERAYAEVTGHSAARKIHECLQSDGEFEAAVTLYPMPRRDELPEIVGKTVERFLHHAHYNTARYLSSGWSKIAEPDGKWYGRDNITMWNVYRISRKLTKSAFDMFVTDEVKQSDLQATVIAYRTLVAKRTPRIKYHRSVRQRGKEMSPELLLKLKFQALNREMSKLKKF